MFRRVRGRFPLARRNGLDRFGKGGVHRDQRAAAAVARYRQRFRDRRADAGRGKAVVAPAGEPPPRNADPGAVVEHRRRFRKDGRGGEVVAGAGIRENGGDSAAAAPEVRRILSGPPPEGERRSRSGCAPSQLCVSGSGRTGRGEAGGIRIRHLRAPARQTGGGTAPRGDGGGVVRGHADPRRRELGTDSAEAGRVAV